MTAAKEWFEEDYYAALGVDPEASPKDITKAYRALAKKYHPDVKSTDASAAEKFKKVTVAYEVVGDEEKRKEYDQIRSMVADGYMGQGDGGGFGFPFTPAPGGQNGDLSDVLSGLFSRMRRTDAPTYQGAAHASSDLSSYDIESQTRISFHQALEGKVETISYTLSGHTKPTEVKVKIPAGVNDGQRIKVTGKGIPTPRGQSGDLYVVVSVGEHPWFGRKGRTLMVKVPISYAESIVGVNVKVPTLDNPVTVKVPPMTKSGTTLRVKGRGADIEGQKGDLLVTFEVTTTQTTISDQEKALFAQLVSIQSENPRAKFGLEQ